MRSWKSYLDFVIKIEPASEGGFRAEAQGPTGEAETIFRLPFDDKDITIFLLEVRQQRQTKSRGRIPEPVQNTVSFGTKLFDAVLSGEVRDLFIASRQSALQKGVGLRLRLRLQNAPELIDLPWEFLNDGRNFIALSNDMPLVHYLDLPNPPRPLKLKLPLRILVTVSSPKDRNLPVLDVDQEQEKIQAALDRLGRDGQVEIEFTADASLITIQRLLRSARSRGRPFHIWHFIGHGGFDPINQTGVLVHSDENGVSSLVNGYQLGTLFESYPEVRLVLLNSCEGARTSRSDPFSSVAAALVEKGIPAAIGMQFEITDKAAIAFSEEFYAALSEAVPVDVAITEARRAVFFLPNWVEWATPVLFMRSPNGTLFNFQVEDKVISPTDGQMAGVHPSRKEPDQEQNEKTKEEPATRKSVSKPIWVGLIISIVILLFVVAGLSIGKVIQSSNSLSQAQTQEWKRTITLTDVAGVGEPGQTISKTEEQKTPIDRLGGTETAIAISQQETKIASKDATTPTIVITPPTSTMSPTVISTPVSVSMVSIPAGEFQMGNDKGRPDERPLHTVYIDEFLIDVFEVTNAQYAKFLNEHGNQIEGGATWLDPEGEDVKIYQVNNEWTVIGGFEDHPVAEITWYGAQAYCTKNGKRLPTEAEWEKAARGGLEGKLYPWGDDLPVCELKAENGAQFEPCSDSTVSVGSFAPNNYGLYDMAGNVWEWVSDWYQEDYYSQSPIKNPEGPKNGKYRVARGGGWWKFNNYELLRVAWRDSGNPSESFAHFGFRCVMKP